MFAQASLLRKFKVFLTRAARRMGVAIALGGLAQAAVAAGYPERPVELIVPWSVGGGTDAVARAFADAAGKHFPQPVIVLNRAGAAGSIGHQEGASARPDGYKLTMVTPEISLALLQGVGKAKFQDFTFIARLNADPIALVVRSDSTWNTLEEFLAHVKANPGTVNVSNSGIGATYHLAAVALEGRAGVSFNNVPYQGAGPAVLGLLGGQVQATLATTGEVGTNVKAGKLRLLAVMADQRLKDFNQVPTFRERGIDLQLGTWRALALPKAAPAEIVASWKQVVTKVVEEPGYRDFFARQFLGLVNEDGDKFRAHLEREYQFYSDIVTRLGLKQ